ncbi:hypothetical protein [Sphingomonas sp. Leaf21]|uniref:hypothetical protein n=1 Tax=Sphingomonas sp. Leaf21 TaxID=2876550 RepID=UPI001E5C0ED8|nr:hypothetical protein [Sphingomonas sp. Leaf21]
MVRKAVGILGLTMMLVATSPALATDEAREPTDIFIRRQVGLPAESARGQIELLDVGHHAMETMVSIVARRDGRAWRISYACAESPQCGPEPAKAYTLSPQASGQVDAILDELRKGQEPDGTQPSPNIVGGYLKVTINDRGFRRDYRRVMVWGQTLGGLERLLSPPTGG